MSEIIDENKLKLDLYDVMRKTFTGRTDLSFSVAEDFSDVELQKFINVYYEYLNK